MNATTRLPALLESFFRRYLVAQRNASPATVASYRDALRLLVLHASARTGREPCRLDVEDLDRDLVLGFLDELETVRGNGPRTRNVRLTAIRSFFRHVAASDPGAIGIAQRVLAIPAKRTTLRAPRHLAERELAALLAAPDRLTTRGRRDHLLFLFLVRTGARVSEAVGVDVADLRLDPPRQVLLHGKGRKERSVPLAPDLVRVIEEHCRELGLGRTERRPLFIGRNDRRLTRFGVVHALRRASGSIADVDLRLRGKPPSPHVLRHTLAMQLLRSDTNLVTIQAWLGHASVETTHRYAEADVEMMRRSLEHADVTPQAAARFQPKDALLRLLESV